MDFSAIRNVMNFTRILERIELDASKLGVSMTRIYVDYHENHLGPQTWMEWVVDWGLWFFGEGIMKLGIVLWVEREAILMYTHLILAALFPIYIGSHASLRRPPSAARPKRSKAKDEDDDEIVVQPPIEGLTPSDAIMFPVLAGLTLGGLYLIIKWLKDPALLNRILGYYFSGLGVFGVGKLATDALNVGTTFIFPSVWSSNKRTYYIDPLISRQVTGKVNRARRQVHREIVDSITSPLPGRLFSSIKFSEPMTKKLWALRSLLKSHWIFRGYLHNVFSVTSKVQIQDITGLILGITAIILYNTWGKLWFLTNLIGFGFCYGTLQILSPTTFWTGSLVLGGLFIYDITMVFYTPLMVTVATSLDVPIKLVFPGVAGKRGSMLGLGDVVLPGIIMALALRFDLYLHYLRKQKTSSVFSSISNPTISSPTTSSNGNLKAQKAEYVDATGNWGERFWTWGSSNADNQTVADSARFKKVYFFASLVGYIIAMITTLVVLKIYNHAQPALLYLVPGVLIALWGTALVRGELSLMWGYTEDGSLDDPNEGQKKDSTAEVTREQTNESQARTKAGPRTRQTDNDAHSLSSFETSSGDDSSISGSSNNENAPNAEEEVVFSRTEKVGGKAKRQDHAQHIFLLSLSTPKQLADIPRKATLFDKP